MKAVKGERYIFEKSFHKKKSKYSNLQNNRSITVKNDNGFYIVV